jgi:hypothetical protein
MNKPLIALSALALLGSVSAASAVEDPENRLADRYPFLERTAGSVATKMTAHRAAMIRTASGQIQVAAEEPEHKLGDRYPFLEPGVAKFAASRAILARRISAPVQIAYEVPEHKLADRYPFLEGGTVRRASAGFAATATMQKQVKKMQKTAKKV